MDLANLVRDVPDFLWRAFFMTLRRCFGALIVP